ncbi:hypothetical protein CUS24_05235 [Enterococcus faecium]|nr:hypothetical protein CUS24_05235 [Enterococcus faecium]
MFLWLKTLYRKRAVTWPFIFYTIIWTLSFLILYFFIFFIFRHPLYHSHSIVSTLYPSIYF